MQNTPWSFVCTLNLEFWVMGGIRTRTGTGLDYVVIISAPLPPTWNAKSPLQLTGKIDSKQV